MSNHIIDFFPKYFRDAENFKAIIDVKENQFLKLDTFLDDACNQLYIDTATWGLDLWDKYAGIKTSYLSIDERRKRIQAKISSLKPITPSIKAVIYDAEISFKSSYVFQVLVKSQSGFGDVVNFIFEQVDLRKPAHLSYELLLDYFAFISIRFSFFRYFSEELKLCGTIDVSGQKYINTNGWSFEESLTTNIYGFNSEEFLVASETTFIKDVDGKSLYEELVFELGKWSSEELRVASQDNFILGSDGKTLNESIERDINKLQSDTFTQASNETFIAGVDGKSNSETLYESLNRFCSEAIKMAGEDSYIGGDKS